MFPQAQRASAGSCEPARLNPFDCLRSRYSTGKSPTCFKEANLTITFLPYAGRQMWRHQRLLISFTLGRLPIDKHWVQSAGQPPSWQMHFSRQRIVDSYESPKLLLLSFTFSLSYMFSYHKQAYTVCRFFGPCQV